MWQIPTLSVVWFQVRWAMLSCWFGLDFYHALLWTLPRAFISVSTPVLSLVHYLIVFTCSVFSPWLVYLFIWVFFDSLWSLLVHSDHDVSSYCLMSMCCICRFWTSPAFLQTSSNVEEWHNRKGFEPFESQSIDDAIAVCGCEPREKNWPCSLGGRDDIHFCSCQSERGWLHVSEKACASPALSGG